MQLERTVRQRVDVVLTLVERDLKLRYRRSVLGIAWSQLGPLATLAVLAILFTRAIPLHIPHYPLFVLVGLLAWTWFAAAMVEATASVATSRDLVRTPGMSLALLPVISISSHLVNLLLALPAVVAAIWIVTGHMSITAALVPLLLAVQFLVILGPTYFLAAWNVRFRDIGHVVGVALLPLFYATPVFYDRSVIPHGYHVVLDANPLSWIISGYRDVLIDGNLPSVGPLLIVTVVAVAVAAAGYRTFRVRAPKFVEEL